MHRVFYQIASILAALAVLFGAFGAHLLKKHLSAEDLASFHTGVTYQMTHSIGVFIVGMMYRHYKTKFIIWAGYFFITGIFLFSGSIYSRILFDYMGLDYGRHIIMLAPVGGIAFVLGWILIPISLPLRKYHQEKSKNEE